MCILIVDFYAYIHTTQFWMIWKYLIITFKRRNPANSSMWKIMLKAYAHVHTHMHTHPTSFSPTFLGTSIDWVFFLPKPKKKKTNPVETHFLAKLQPTKGKQAGVSPDYRPNHQSARLPGQQRKDAVRGTVLADPVSTASGARSLRVQASCLERQPLSPD